MGDHHTSYLGLAWTALALTVLTFCPLIAADYWTVLLAGWLTALFACIVVKHDRRVQQENRQSYTPFFS